MDLASSLADLLVTWICVKSAGRPAGETELEVKRTARLAGRTVPIFNSYLAGVIHTYRLQYIPHQLHDGWMVGQTKLFIDSRKINLAI